MNSSIKWIFCEDFLFRTIWSRLLVRIEEIRLNIWPDIPWDVSLWRRPACQTLSKTLDIASATAQVALGLLKAQAILSDTIVKRSAVDQKDLKPCWKSEKRQHFSRWSTILVFKKEDCKTSFSKRLLTGQ